MKICIITSVRNCLTETKAYLDSLRQHAPSNLDQVIMIDDGSDKETQEFLHSQRSSFDLYRNSTSKGFAFSNNLGAAKANAEWLLFLNNDLVLQKNWSVGYDCVVEGNQKLANIGCVGNVQLDPFSGKIDHAGVIFSNGIPEHFLKGKKLSPQSGYTEFLAVTGACFMIRRDLFLAVGGFDETYKTGFEDIDLCLRLSMLGHKNYVLNSSIVLHKRSSTPERNQHQDHNSRVFYRRWGRVITRFQEWEVAQRKQEVSKRNLPKEYDYVLKKKENFLFSDKKILHEYFSIFLHQRNLKFAKHILSILLEKFGHEEQTQIKLARFHGASGELKQAKATLSDVLHENPRQLEASLLKQKLCCREGDIKSALSILRETKGYHPASARVYLAISKCLQESTKWKEAEKNARVSTLLDSSFKPGWRALSFIFRKQGKIKDEVQVLQVLLQQDPRDSKVLDQLITALASLHSNRKIWLLCKQYEGKIFSASSVMHGAHACYEIGDFKRSVHFVEKLLDGDPANANALMLRGNIAVAGKQFAKAIADYEKVLEIMPNSLEALSNLSNSKSFLCDWADRETEVNQLNTVSKKAPGKLGLFEVSGLQLDEASEFHNALAKSKIFNTRVKLLREKLMFTYSQNENVRKKVGFLSSDFRNHAVGHQFIGLLNNLGSEKYEIFLFASNPSEDSDIRRRYEDLGDNFQDISGLSLTGKAIAINQANLDLLIDLGGFSRGHNAELLALRPSPRQAHFLGYASTMGKDLVDYMIADRVVIPSSSSKFYGEQVIRMDGCFFPPGEFQGFASRVKRKDAGLPPRGFVFCAFHAAYKLDPEIWASWMRILRAVPESILWLKCKPAVEALINLKAEAVRQGVSSKRIIMAEDLPDRAAHLSRMTVADLYLDCPLYNGHASAMDALHAKLPILTLEGKRFCSRVGESLMKHFGLPEMVTKNLEQYERKAIELGKRPSKLLPLRKKISKNADAVLSPAVHAERFQTTIEAILTKKPKAQKIPQGKKSKASMKLSRTSSLKDFTLVMIRPKRITNWAYNVNMLAQELRKEGGQTIIIEPAHAEHKRSDFSSFVKRVPQLGQSYAEILNFALSKVSTKYAFYLDDPLRTLPASHFIECLTQSIKTLQDSKIGFLGVGSKMEPNTGVLVTTTKDSSGASKVAGLFAPFFALSMDALIYTGGFRPYDKSLALSCLDLSLRMEQQGDRSALVELDKITCPAYTGNDYLKSAGEKMLSHFRERWNRKPVSLKPKYPAKEEQVGETADYQEWIRLCDTITKGDILAFRAEADKLQNTPLISVIMPVFDPPKKFLVKAIESVLTQAYENWELCIADDASTKKYIRPLLETYARKDSRIKVTFRKKNGHISVASNSAIKLATGEFVAFLDHDDELRPHSLLEVAKVINRNPNAQLIYSDEDNVDEQGGRYNPYFKPDWNPDLLLGQNYICHLSTFKTLLVKELKGLRKGFEGAQDWDLILRITEKLSKESIIHIPKILYHWRAIKGSTALGVLQKKNIFEATALTINQALERRGLNASLSFPDRRYNYPKIGFKIDKRQNPKVSILIPTKDRVDLMKKCLSSILKNISYDNYEVIIIDNESVESQSISFFSSIKKDRRVSVIRVEGDFNYSRLNNIAASKANGEILLLLNNDIESIKVGWFEEMLVHALRPEIGCVGAKLLYPDGRLQHGGVIVGLGGGAGHSHKYAQGGSLGYAGQLSVARNSTAVTAACIMVRKQAYMAAGGLDESHLKVAFNDVDFCLRVEKIGYLNFWTPFAELYHHESASRGSDEATTQKKKRSSREILGLRNRWNLRSFSDNNYNSNLTNWSEQFWFGISKKSSAYPADFEDFKMVEEIDDTANSKTKIPDGSPHKRNASSSLGKKLVKQGHLKLESGLRCNKEKKIPLIFPLLKKQFQGRWREYFYDCMPQNADNLHGVVETENISKHEYDGHAMNIINTVGGNGMILDCGSGQRPTYYSNVVNFDPVAYGSTDVVGVGEHLPFNDISFDAVFSLNVLEHVRDPFACAKEIIRVLKPGGQLYCVAPLLTPYHGYPDHYYNMTKAGLRNLFEENLVIKKQDVLDSGHPIYSLTWILNSWIQGLKPNAKKAFLRTSVSELLGDPASYFDKAYVNSLNLEKKFELGATTALWAEKKNSDMACSGDLFLQIRSKVYQTLSGKGLEIGAFEHPAELPSSCEVKYFDRISTEQAKVLFPEISHKKLPKVDIIGDLDEKGIVQIPNESFEFVIMNHVLEHLFDPIQAIKESLRILKPGGSLVMSVPDKRFTFDLERKLTKWDLLLKRYQKELKKPKLENYEEIYKVHPNLKGKTLSKKEKISFLKECTERREHLNVWDSTNFKKFLTRTLKFIEVEVNFEKEVSGDESHFEYLVHLKKIAFSCPNLKLNNFKSSLDIFSLHIPKTGGTSFRKCLREIYGNNFIPHYPELGKQGSESLDALINGKCVHGHLILDRYQELCEGADLVTWLRNPVDRTLSLYHHILSNPDSSNEFHQRVYRQKPSIIEFCEMPENQNQLFYWIGDRNPEDFKFIGFLETAQASIVKCAAALGWSYVPQFPWDNKTKKRDQLKVSSKDREFIKAKNQGEMSWIENAKKLFG